MISLTYDLDADTLKLASAAAMKLGADVPVTLAFATAPGTVSTIQLALGNPNAPAVLAFTEDFSAENETTWTAFLDCSDTRLAAFLQASSGTGSQSVNLEVVAVIDGARRVSPNLSISVQPAVIIGPQTTQGGPVYQTQAAADARYLQQAAADNRYGRDLYITLPWHGDAALNAIFGYWSPPHNVQILGGILCCQNAPTGAALTVDLLNAGGAEQTHLLTLAAAAADQETTYGTPLAWAAGAALRLKIKSIGSGTAGQNLTVILHARTTA